MKDSPELLSVFSQALECQSAADQSAYLDGACRDNADLRARVEGLLRAHERAPNFLEGNAAKQSTAGIDGPVMEGPGTDVGPYRLLEQVGEGGFGVVFMAEQHQPVRRTVAVKVLKPGMDTRQIVARFEAERQVLALMDHPNIAKILDAGTTEPIADCRLPIADCKSAISTGRPYFVMELVRGVPITEFCDQKQLPVRDRLELF